MCFGLGNIDVADKVGVGNFFTFGDGLFGEILCWCLQHVWRGDRIYLHPVPGGKCVGGGNLPSRFLRDGTKSLERGLSTGIGVNHCGSGGNYGARLLVARVSGRISMWS